MSAPEIRGNIESLVLKKDFHGAVVQCEELEILTASVQFGEEHEHWAKVHMALLLVLDDANNARHLWRRLPVAAKAEGGELAALWGVGKFLCTREMAKAKAALRGRDWEKPIAPFIDLLRERVSERQVRLISQAYTCLPLDRAAEMMGCGIDEAEQECSKQGWAVEPGEPKMVKPVPIATVEAEFPAPTPDYLQLMARHITFLERQHLG